MVQIARVTTVALWWVLVASMVAFMAYGLWMIGHPVDSPVDGTHVPAPVVTVYPGESPEGTVSCGH